jgi:hypothetical protein
MTRPKPLTRDQLVDRHVYRLTARNFFLGAWDAAYGGFLGIREKFGHRYVFTEYFSEPDRSSGTAHAWTDTGVVVPEEIELKEYLGSQCSEHSRPVKFVENEPGISRRGRWMHADDETALDEDDSPMAISNRALFDFLEPLAAEEDERWRLEQGV